MSRRTPSACPLRTCIRSTRLQHRRRRRGTPPSSSCTPPAGLSLVVSRIRMPISNQCRKFEKSQPLNPKP
eukprot:100431-Pyramimonas_sp.AAC.1